jgi:hypothetical protein
MKSRHVRLLVLLSLSLAALAACSDAVYATVESEKKTATNTLSQTLSVFDIAVPVAGTYYIAAGGIFQGTYSASTNSVTWNPDVSKDNLNNIWANRPWNPAGLICNAMTQFGANLYGGFSNVHDGTSSFWKSDASYSFGTSSAAQLSLATPGEQVTMLQSTSSYLFVCGTTTPGSSPVGQLDYSATPGSAWTTALSGLPYAPVGVANIGLTYWTASGSTLYVSTSLPTFNPVTAQSWGTINGVFADSLNNRVFVVTKSNGIFYSTDGGVTWPAANHINPDVVGTVTVSYLTVAGPIASNIYLVGSDGYGYYTLTIGGGISRYGDSTTLLYYGSVSRIVLDPTNYVVLMGTNSKGLWRTVYDPASGSVPASGQSWINE